MVIILQQLLWLYRAIVTIPLLLLGYSSLSILQVMDTSHSGGSRRSSGSQISMSHQHSEICNMF